MTNHEHIKKMSVEDLALMLMCPAEYDNDFNKNGDCMGEMNRNCFECAKKWLESEEQQ